MKAIFFIVASCCFIQTLKAQKVDSIKEMPADTQIYMAAEHDPEFPGGLINFSKYVGMNIRYPKGAYLYNIQGKVVVQFVVEKDGSISNLTIIRSASRSLDEEAMRIIRNSPKWKPATQNGLSVRMYFAMPIVFKLDPNVHFN